MACANNNQLRLRPKRCVKNGMGIRQTHPTEVANGAAVDARLTQPETQGAQDQQQWQACGKAQEQHAQTGWLHIDTP